MSLEYPQDRDCRRRDADRNGKAGVAARAARGGRRGHRKSLRGRYVEDLAPLIAMGEELGKLLSERAVAALGIAGSEVQSYGKAALVGENGEMEHAAALLHPKMGAPVRSTLGKGAALIPSSKKRAGLAPNSTFPSATRMRLMCARTLTGCRSASATRRAPTKSSSPLRSPPAAGLCRGWAASNIRM